MARRFDYFFRETVTGLRRNGLVAFAAVSTVFISLFLFGGALLIGKQIDLVIDAQTERVEVAIYLADSISQNDQERIGNMLADMPEVSTYYYESKKEAYERFKKLFANQPDLVNNISANALPASFRVKLHDPTNDFDVIAATLAGQPGIERIVDQRSILRRLRGVYDVLRIGALGAAAVMLLSAVALIANTVRMAVFARRKEIGIMRLVGATSWFIRVPFMIEGLVEGLLGAGLAILALTILRHVFFNELHTKIAFFPIISSGALLAIIPLILAVGVAVAVIASFIAMRRFLDV